MTIFLSKAEVDTESLPAVSTLKLALEAAERRMLNIYNGGWSGRGREYYATQVAEQQELIAKLKRKLTARENA